MKTQQILPLVGVMATVTAIVALVLLNPGTAAESGQASATPDSTDKPAAPATSTWNGQFVMPHPDELRARLTPLQYEVTQHEATERSFRNEYWDNKQDGIYVDVVSGQPLFSSTDKFRSGTGWPSFTRPISPDALTAHTDSRFFMKRT